MVEISKDNSIENQMIVFSHVVICSLLPKTHQITELNDFINEISEKLDQKTFKGKLLSRKCKSEFFLKPCYKHHNCCVEASHISNHSFPNITAFSGLFGVIFGVAILYSIKNR